MMKDEYFTPVADMLAFDYANVVSASFDTPVVPTMQNGNKCDVPPVKHNPKKCSGGSDPIVKNKPHRCN